MTPQVVVYLLVAIILAVPTEIKIKLKWQYNA